jgi:hypothetical protein
MNMERKISDSMMSSSLNSLRRRKTTRISRRVVEKLGFSDRARIKRGDRRVRSKWRSSLCCLKTAQKSESTLSISSRPNVRGRLCNLRKLGASPFTSKQRSSKTEYASEADGSRGTLESVLD